jgi:CelD/BcsL family acetyltransferase involved in cellulose biosynthesis
MDLEVRCVADLAAIAPDRWDALLAGAGDAAVFSSRPFLQAWQRAFCAGDCSCRLDILTVWDGVALIGAAPFYLTVVDLAARAREEAQAPHWQRVLARAQGSENPPAARTARGADAGPAAPPDSAPRVGERVLRLAGGVAVADYLDVLALPGRAADVWQAALGYWGDHAAEWDVLDLHSLVPASARLAGAAAAARGWQVWSGVEETCPALDLPGDWDTYLARLGKKDRHEIRRKLRRIEERDDPIRWTVGAEGPELAAALEEFLELHRLSGVAKAEFMTPAMEAFFRGLLAAFAGTGQIEIATLYVAETPAAAYLSFRAGASLLLYNSGYDPAFSDIGAGFALVIYRIRGAIEQGLGRIDFLRGDERYKYDLGASDNFICRVICRK